MLLCFIVVVRATAVTVVVANVGVANVVVFCFK